MIQQTDQEVLNSPTLRGGGCGASKNSKSDQSTLTQKGNFQLPEDFSEQLRANTEIIQSKALLINDQSNQSEVMISIQWFICMEETFILISCNQQLVTNYFDLIKACFIDMLSVINTYLRAAGTICLYVLRIMSQLSKIIFYFYLQNKNVDRFMKEDEKQDLLQKILELEQQAQIEASNIWATGIEFEILILKACIKNLPSDSNKGYEIMFNFIASAAKSIATMSLDDNLIDTLLEGATFMLDKYQTHNLQQLYQLYYSLDLIKWSLIQQLKVGQNAIKIINQITQTHKKYILNSSDWMTHFCWIKLIQDLLNFRPIISMEKLVSQNAKSIWNQLVEQKILSPLSFSKQKYSRLNLFDDHENYFEVIQPVFVQFKGISELKKLQVFLTSFTNQEINLFPVYISQRKLMNHQTNVQKSQVIQCRKFLFLDKSVEYISDLTDIAQEQMSMLVINISDILQKLLDIPQLLINDDSNMIENQIEKYIDALKVILNQSQSIILLSMFIYQYKNYYLSKQNLLVAELGKLFVSHEKEIQFCEQLKKNLNNLNQICVVNPEKIINQQFQIQEKLQVILNSLTDVLQNEQINGEMNSTLETLNQILPTMNKEIVIIQALTELQQLSKLLIQQQVEIKCYQNKMYDDSKILNGQTLQLIDFKTMTQQLINFYQLTQADIKCYQNQVEIIQSRFENSGITAQSQLISLNSNFTFSHQILSLGQELQQLQLNLWEHGVEQQKKMQSNQNISKIMGQKNIGAKIENDFLKKLDQAILIFNDLSNQSDIQLSRVQTNQSDSSEEKDFLNLVTSLQGLKQQLSSPQSEKIRTNKIIKDIDIICKILSTKTFFKLQLRTEYKLLLEDLKKQYQTEDFASQQQGDKDKIQSDVSADAISAFTKKTDSIKNILSQYQELCKMSKQTQEIIQGSHQTLIDVQQEQVYQQITNNLYRLIEQKVKEFMDSLKQLITQFKEFEDQPCKQFQCIDFFNESEFFNLMENIFEENYLEQGKLIFSKLRHLEQFKEKTFFGDIVQKSKDIWNKEGYRLREAVAVACIFISSNIYENQFKEYCQDILIKIWASEKDERVKKILKNKDLLVMQTKIFSSDLKNANEKLKEEIKYRFSQLEKLEQELKQEGDPQKREKLSQILTEEFKQFEEYVDNMNDMNSEVKLQIEFLKTISKQLKKMEDKINQLQASLNEVCTDLKFLRGKKYDQLLQIRKQQVLQNKNKIDLQSVYVDLRTIEKDVMTGQYLQESALFVEDISNDQGEVNEFLWGHKDLKKEVMLIHGCAGSGKSTAARKIEEFLWAIYDLTSKRDNNLKLLPIYVSLPTIKEPEQNVVEQTLESEAYHFDSIQLREFKEAIEKNEFRLVLILDSYDEIKSKFISKNLYKSNRLKEVWGNPKVIFTTRTEILTSHHYPIWFCGAELSGLKEIQIQRFDQIQRNKYLTLFCEVMVKKQLIEVYKYYLEIENKKMNDLDQFMIIWKPIQHYLSQVSTKNKFYLTNSDIQTIIKMLKKNDWIKRISEEQIINFQKELENLWGKKKFDDTIQNIQIENLLETPFMMEIVVQVLPIMTKKYTEYIQQKDVFIQNFTAIKQKQIKEKNLIRLYREQNGLSFEDQEKDTINIPDKAAQLWEILEAKQFFQHFSIASKINKDALIKVDTDITDPDIIINALERHNLTQYDFYQSFVEFYHSAQIQKLRDQGKQINYESFLLDLNEFSMKLALEMTKNQLTQVSYKFSGQLKFNKSKNISQEQWEDDFFNDLEIGGDYKKLIRSAVLLGQKGSIYFFVHKSIQEFLIAKHIYQLLQLPSNFNYELLQTCLEFGSLIQFKQDCSFVNFLQKHYTLIISEISKKFVLENNSESKITQLGKDLRQIVQYLAQLQDDYINQINLSKEEFLGSLKYLKEKINLDIQIRQLILLISKLSAIDPRYIRLSSNFLYLITNMLEYLGEQDFRNIVLEDTSIAGATFHGSDFSGSVMKNVNISGINLNKAILANVEWSNLRINELPSSLGHEDQITCIDFSPDGSKIVSSSMDKSIKLWDANSGKIIQDFIGHSDWVLSVAFSPNAVSIASCGCDKSIIIWSIEKTLMEKKLLGHNATIKKVLFSPDGLNILSGGDDLNLKLWKLEDQMVMNSFVGHKETINSFCFSSDGKLIVSCSQDQTIIIWDKSEGSIKTVIRKHAFSVCFSPDSSRIVSGGQNQVIYIWDVKGGSELSSIKGHTNAVLAVCYSKDGNRIASGSSDKTIRLWDSKNTKEIQRFEGHLEFVNQVIFSPNGQKLVSGSKDNTIRQWDITAGKESIKLEGHTSAVNALSFTPDGLSLVSGSFSDQIQIWDAHSGKLKMKIKNSQNEAKLAISPDGELIASRNKTNLIIRNLKTGDQVKVFEIENGLITSIIFSQDGKYIATTIGLNLKTKQKITLGKDELDEDSTSNDDVLSAAFAPNDQAIVIGSQNASITLYNYEKKTQQTIFIHKNAVSQVAFTLDGKSIISTSNDYTISIYDIQLEKQIHKLECHQSEVLSLAISLDGQRFAAGSWDKTISLWKFDKKQTNIKDQIYDWPIYYLGQQNPYPDPWEIGRPQEMISANILVSGGFDNKVRLWNLNTGQELLKLTGHQSKIISVTISKDCKQIAATNKNNLVIIWNAQNGQELKRFQEIKQLNSIISFSTNGTFLAVGGVGNLIIVYNLEMWEKAYSQHLEQMMYLQFLSFWKQGWKFNYIYFDLHSHSIVNEQTNLELKLPSEDFIQQESVSCYKVISEHVTSLKSQDAYICNSNIKSQLGFDIQILLEQRGGHILQ